MRAFSFFAPRPSTIYELLTLIISAFVSQIVVFLFAPSAAEGIVETGLYCVLDETESFFVHIESAAAHSTADFVLVVIGLRSCWTMRRDLFVCLTW